MSASLTAAPLTPDGLPDDQLRHFAEHGWVVLEQVLDEQTCQRYIEAIDYTMARLRHAADSDDTHHRAVVRAHLFHPLFVDLLGTAGLIPALRQLVGVRDVRLLDLLATTESPHPQRLARRSELLDPQNWGWHRDFRPRWIIQQHEAEPGLVNSLVVSAAFYFTGVSPERGATAFLDGSHRHDGPYDTVLYEELREQCDVVQPTVGPGTIALFSESLLHSAVPVVGDLPRYAAFAWVAAPWFGGEPDMAPPYKVGRLVDEEVAGLFRPHVANMHDEFG